MLVARGARATQTGQQSSSCLEGGAKSTGQQVIRNGIVPRQAVKRAKNARLQSESFVGFIPNAPTTPCTEPSNQPASDLNRKFPNEPEEYLRLSLLSLALLDQEAFWRSSCSARNQSCSAYPSWKPRCAQ